MEPTFTDGVTGAVDPSVLVPAGWVDDAAAASVDEARSATRLSTPSPTGSSLRPTFVVELRREPSAITVHDLRHAHAGALAEELEQARVVDAGACIVGEWEAHRVLVAHQAHGIDVTTEQWALPRRRRTTLITATAATPDYAALFQTLQELVGSVELDA